MTVDHMREDYRTVCLIAVDKPVHKEFLKKISAGWAGSNILFLTDSLKGSAELSKIGIQAKILDDYRTNEDTHMESMRQAASLLGRLGEVEVKKGETLKRLIFHEGVSLWKMADVELTMYFFTEKIDKINILLRVLDRERPQRILIVRSASEWSRIFAVVADERRIPFCMIGGGVGNDLLYFADKFMVRKDIMHLADKFIPLKRGRYGRTQLFVWMPKKFFYFFKYKEKLFKKLKAAMISRTRAFKSPTRGAIIFLAPVKRYVSSIAPVRKVLKDVYAKDSMIIDTEMIEVYKMLKPGDMPYRIIFEYYNLRIAFRIQKARSRLIKTWHRIISQPVFHEAFRYKGIGLWRAFEPDFQDRLLFLFFTLIDTIELAKEMIRRDSPSFIVATDDCGALQRTMVEVSRLHGIKSLDLLVYSVSEYSFTWKNLSTDIVALEGEYAQKIFLSQGIDKNRVFVTGQPRFDFMVDKDRIFDTDKIYKKLSVPRGKRIVTLTTNPVVVNINENEKLILLKEVYGAIKDLAGYHLVVKLHPSDFDGSLEKKIARELSMTNITVARDMDIGLWELFYVSDLVITTVSTTGPEAIAMDRLLIQVKLNQIEPDWMPCARSGAALGVERPEEIRPTILDALNNLDPIRKRLSPYREKFIENQFYRIDGKASQRVAELINSFTDGYKKTVS